MPAACGPALCFDLVIVEAATLGLLPGFHFLPSFLPHSGSTAVGLILINDSGPLDACSPVTEDQGSRPVSLLTPFSYLPVLHATLVMLSL